MWNRVASDPRMKYFIWPASMVDRFRRFVDLSHELSLAQRAEIERLEKLVAAQQNYIEAIDPIVDDILNLCKALDGK